MATYINANVTFGTKIKLMYTVFLLKTLWILYDKNVTVTDNYVKLIDVMTDSALS